MRTAIFILVLVVAATAAREERVEVVWEQRFGVSALDGSEWQFEGAVGLRWRGLWTKSDPERPVFNRVHGLREEPTPTTQGPVRRLAALPIPWLYSHSFDCTRGATLRELRMVTTEVTFGEPSGLWRIASGSAQPGPRRG